MARTPKTPEAEQIARLDKHIQNLDSTIEMQNEVLETSRARVRSLEAEVKAATDREQKLQQQCHEFRTGFDQARLRAAELQGYVKALSDRQPPRVAPESRSDHLYDLLNKPETDVDHSWNKVWRR